MRSSILFLAASLTSVLAVPAPQQASGTLGLGENCSTSAECANGVNCYSTNSGLIKRCGNFQASCSSDAQCAFNTCRGGLCNGFIASSSATATTKATASQSSSAPISTSTADFIPLGKNCVVGGTPCAGGADCYASNFMLQTRCGNFLSTCTTDAQCAFNPCNGGVCSGFFPSNSSSSASSRSGAPTKTASAIDYPAQTPPAAVTTPSVSPPTNTTTTPTSSPPVQVKPNAGSALKIEQLGLTIAGFLVMAALL